MAAGTNVNSWFAPFKSLVRSESLAQTPATGGGLGLAGAPKRPELNGKLLHNPAGTVWQVIDGVARGFVSAELFERLHYWSRTVQMGQCGGGFHAGVCWTVVQAVKWIEVPDVPAFIEERAPFDASVRLIRNPAGTVCLYESNSKRPIASSAIMDQYQFDWDKVMVLEDAVYNAIPTGPLVPA